MKGLFLGIGLIIIVGIGGLVYRNAIEHSSRTVACPMDALLCPDGTAVGRTGDSCTFSACPLPNVSLTDIGISFAIPKGFIAEEAGVPDAKIYRLAAASSTGVERIVIHRYEITASSTALEVIRQTAINATSELPASVTSFTSTTLGNRRFTVVPIERFEGIIDTAYYLARNTDVLRFDAVDYSADWTNSNLVITALPVHTALIQLLTTLQSEGR